MCDQQFDNQTPNQGAQGQFHGPVNVDHRQTSGERAAGIGGDANAPVTTSNQNTVTNQSFTAGGNVENVRQVTVGTGGTYIESREQPKPRQLCAPVADFVGREREIAELHQALTSGNGAVAICGVRGMGGIGKTELAMVVANQLAAQFPDGQIVVDLFGTLNPISPEHAVQEAIRAFDREAKLPDDLPSLQALYRQQCSGKRVLVLADDAKNEAQVRPLLPPAGCALLITSRPPIVLPGMHTHKLDTLLPAEAEKLLRDVCQRIGNDAPELARLCGYLPLALRVSATFLKRRPTRSVAVYLQNLRDEQARLAHLRDPKDPTLNVEASLALSYDALQPKVQQAFAQLGVFVGSFTLEAAEAVVEVVGNTGAELLEELYLSSLLDYDEGSDRYNLHDLVRVFALARLDDQHPTRLRHARYYAEVASYAEDKLYLKEQPLAGLARFDQERHHIDTAWMWLRQQAPGDATDSLLIDFAQATAEIGMIRYDLRHERIPQLEAQLAAGYRLSRRDVENMALGNLGRTYNELGAYQRAVEYHNKALSLSRELGKRDHEAAALGNLGIAYKNTGAYRRALACYEQHQIIAHESGHRWSESNALSNMGLVHYMLGQPGQARTYSEQALTLSREIGNRPTEGRVLGNMGLLSCSLGNYQEAIDYSTHYLTIAREIGDRRDEGMALAGLGRTYHHLGEYKIAMEYLNQSLSIAREIGHQQDEGYVLGNLGDALSKSGNPHDALEYYERMLSIMRDVGDRRGESDALDGLGAVYREENNVENAITCYTHAIDIDRQIGYHEGIAHHSWHLGLLYEQQGELAQAVLLIQVAVDFFQQIGHENTSYYAEYLEQMRQRLCEQGD